MVLSLMEDNVEGNEMEFRLEHIKSGRCLRNVSRRGVGAWVTQWAEQLT